MKLVSIIITLLLALVACASPTVVTERQADDENLSCSALVAAIQEAEEYEEEARDDRGVTGTNAVAVIFFWPGLIGTYANTGDAIDAAEDRQEYLTGIYDQKSCGVTSERATGDIANQLRELRSMFDDGLITEEEYGAARARVLGL